MAENQKTFFEEVKELGIEFDNHYSDLYIPVSAVTIQLVKNHPEVSATQFLNQGDGTKGFWFDIPFQYTPFWEKIQ